MTRKIKPPPIPDIPKDFDPRLRAILDAMQQNIDLREGRMSRVSNERNVNIQDLIDVGLVDDGDIT